MKQLNHIPYHPKPDYTRPVLEISAETRERMLSRLRFLYVEEQEINEMVRRATEEHKAYVSYKTGQDGKEEPYEINTTWFGALNREDCGEELSFQDRRFVASRSIALVLKGVPAIYFHGMIGTGNDPEVVKRSGHNLDINRIR